MIFYRNVAALMLSVALLQVATGALGVALPLAMAGEGWSGLVIGAVAAAYAAGFMFGAWMAPSAIRAIGHIRAFAAFAGVAAALTLFLGLDTSEAGWSVARFGFGVCNAVLFAVAESWIADATPSERRGAVIAVYQILGRAGLIVGPFLIALPGIDLTKSFIIAGAFVALALAPITATRRQQPRPPSAARVSITHLLGIAPAAVAAVFAAGLINTGVLAFVPIWAEGLAGAAPENAADEAVGAVIGAGAGAAALVMAGIYAASMAAQWPAGKISDSLDRRLVVAGLAAASGALALLLALLPGPGVALGVVLISLWGACSLGFYAIAVAHAADRSALENLPAMASGMLMVWAAGSVIGPVIAGAFFASPLGARGVFLFAGVSAVALTALMLWRSKERPAPMPEEREEFVNLHATSAALVDDGDEPAENAGDDGWPGDSGEDDGSPRR
ncbi:MAG: MFS transporter [Maricaulaceae bacterium]|nr:MFS transporter [Maricaulaceae bacterium]